MTTKSLLDNLRRLESPPDHTGDLRPMDKLRTIASRRGVAVSPTPQGGTGGISSPLIETGREYYETMDYAQDGAFIVFRAKPIKTLTFKDAEGNPVEMQFKEPAGDV